MTNEMTGRAARGKMGRRHHTEQLQKVQIVNDVNKDFVIEAFRSIAELITYGDQHDPSFFEFLMEKQIMGEFVRILKISRSAKVALQLLRTMSIMIQNLKKSQENLHYGTPINPQLFPQIPGGSSSGSAVAVAAGLVDFALGTGTIGCVRIPAAFCGILGYRPSHGVVSNIGVLSNSQSLGTIGLFARDPSIFHRVGHLLLQASQMVVKRERRFIFADDFFQYSRIPKQKTLHVISKAIGALSGYQPAKHMNVSHYVASNVPILKEFCNPSTKLHHGTSTLQALSTIMLSLQKRQTSGVMSDRRGYVYHRRDVAGDRYF